MDPVIDNSFHNPGQLALLPGVDGLLHTGEDGVHHLVDHVLSLVPSHDHGQLVLLPGPRTEGLEKPLHAKMLETIGTVSQLRSRGAEQALNPTLPTPPSQTSGTVSQIVRLEQDVILERAEQATYPALPTTPHPTPPTPSRCIPDQKSLSSQLSGTVSQTVKSPRDEQVTDPTLPKPSRRMPDQKKTSSQVCGTGSQILGPKQVEQASHPTLPTAAHHVPPMPSRCIPGQSSHSSQTSGSVSQQEKPNPNPPEEPTFPTHHSPSRCMPDHSPDSSQPSGTVSQKENPIPPEKPTFPTTHSPSRCTPANSLPTSTTSTLSSSNMRKETRKVERTWQELSRDDKNEVKILKVVDFGLTRSARRMPRTRQESINPDLLTTPTWQEQVQEPVWKKTGTSMSKTRKL